MLAGARAGEEWAWTVLYDEYAGLVLGYLRSKHAPEPEDLTSDVFVKIVGAIDSFKGDEGDFRSWLLTITHHRLVDAFRKKGRRATDPMEAEALATSLPPVQGEDEVVERLTTQEILRLLDHLTEDQREALVLRLTAGLSTREIAEIVGKNRNAVKQLQRRAIESLRRLLEEHPYPIDPDGR